IAGPQQSEWRPCDYRESSSNYFRAMGIALHLGRGILETDTENSSQVVVVNEAFAQKYFSGRSPLGEHILLGGASREIVGVVADAKSYLDRPALPTAFLPATQASFEGSKMWENWFPRSIVLRTSVDPLGLSRGTQVRDFRRGSRTCRGVLAKQAAGKHGLRCKSERPASLRVGQSCNDRRLAVGVLCSSTARLASGRHHRPALRISGAFTS